MSYRYPGYIKFEVLHDPKAAAMIEGLQLRPAVAERLDHCEWILAARRYAERPTLTLFRHKITGRFILGDIIYGDDIVQELEGWDEHPGVLGISMEWIKMRCVPQEEMARRIFENLREASYTRKALSAETEEERNDTARWLKRTGREDLAALTRMQPYTGQKEGGDRLAETQDRLASLAKCVG